MPPVTNATITVSEARQHFASLLNRVFREGTRVVVEKSGIPVAALVSTEDLARLQRLDAERVQRFAVIDDMRAAFQDVPAEELEREAERALREIRAERVAGAR